MAPVMHDHGMRGATWMDGRKCVAVVHNIAPHGWRAKLKNGMKPFDGVGPYAGRKINIKQFVLKRDAVAAIQAALQ